jgi:hypothetical protein
MSEATTATTPDASATTPAATPAAAAAAAATAPASTVVKDPPYMSDRLERERRSVLKQLGVKAPKDIPAASAIQEAKKNIQGQKERRRAAEKDANESKAKLADLESKVGVIKTYADLEMQSLDDKTRDIVKALAGEDPAEQLRQIGAMRALGKATQAATAAPATADKPKDTPAAVATNPAPANTAPPGAPAPSTTQAQLPVSERYAQIKAISDPTQREAAKLFFVLENEAELLTLASKR